MAADKIFVCYRRDDSAGHAGRLYDRLNQRFPGRVFMDVAGIGIGTRWAEVIDRTMRSCGVAVIVIGKSWVAKGPDGERRIDKPDDPIRGEVTTALRLKLRIVPLLISGAALPDAKDLPPDVAPLLDWQAVRVEDDDYDHDVKRLIYALETELHDAHTDHVPLETGAKDTEVRRLMGAAEPAIAKADWITAAQTLRSVLSLDPAHAHAADRLRFAEEQMRQAYRPPPAAVARTKRWALVGAGALGAALLLGALVSQEVDPTDPFVPIDPMPAPVVDTSQVEQTVAQSKQPTLGEPSQPSPPAARASSPIVGSYALDGYYIGGEPLPITGTMRLEEATPQMFRFRTIASNPLLGVTFQYGGVLQNHGGVWSVTYTESNDPDTIIGQPIPTTVSFDGDDLELVSGFVSATWAKQH